MLEDMKQPVAVYSFCVTQDESGTCVKLQPIAQKRIGEEVGHVRRRQQY